MVADGSFALAVYGLLRKERQLDVHPDPVHEYHDSDTVDVNADPVDVGVESGRLSCQTESRYRAALT